MGKKNNSNIFQLGIKQNEWDSKYFEKSKEEFSLLHFQNNQIEQYLVKFFNDFGLILHYYKYQITNKQLYIFVSYFITTRASFKVKNLNFNKKIILKKKKRKRKIYKKKMHKTKKRVFLLKFYKKTNEINKHIYLNKFIKNNFINTILESISSYTNKKYHVTLLLQNINKKISNINRFSVNSKKRFKNKIFKELRRYSRNIFFKDAIKILFLLIRIKKSTKLFSKFISNHMQFMRIHSFFINFLKRAVKVFINSEISLIKGIKILIKGKMNNRLRAKKRVIKFGQISLKNIDSKISHSESTVFTQKGTIGVKIWVCEKERIMRLQPKKFKYKKIRKGKLLNFNNRTNKLNFGVIGLKAAQSGFVSATQLEAARQAITRKVQRKGKLWICIYPDIPVTRKPTEVRMGRGVGKINHWSSKVKGGTVLFEICGVEIKTAITAFKTGGAKLPIKTKIFN